MLALAGAAALEADAGHMGSAAERLVLCTVLRPNSLASEDGLGLTPQDRAAAMLVDMDESTASGIIAAFLAALHPLN